MFQFVSDFFSHVTWQGTVCGAVELVLVVSVLAFSLWKFAEGITEDHNPWE